MLKTTSVALLTVAVMANEELHPVREEVVEQIKLRATSWKPKEVQDNHLRHKSVEGIKNSMGNYGTSRKSIGSEVFKKVAHGASDAFH